MVADALSRRDAEEGTKYAALSAPLFTVSDDIRAAVAEDTAWDGFHSKADRQEDGWAWINGLLVKAGKVFVPRTVPLVQSLFAKAHGTAHEGVQKTLHRLRADFYIPGDKGIIQQFVRQCKVCQRNKTDHLRPGGLLPPLPVPAAVWADLAMDFVEGFPKVNGKSVILTVVDCFSKYAHFIPISHPYTAASVARVFFDEIIRLHRIPSSIVSDRDPVLTSSFWKELFQLAGVKLQYTSAFHPQSDGQSEATNKIIMMYLRCLTGDRP